VKAREWPSGCARRREFFIGELPVAGRNINGVHTIPPTRGKQRAAVQLNNRVGGEIRRVAPVTRIVTDLEAAAVDNDQAAKHKLVGAAMFELILTVPR